MSLELKKETLRPNNPADMALKFWKNESKKQDKRMSLKEFYMRRELYKALNIPDFELGAFYDTTYFLNEDKIIKPEFEQEFKNIINYSREELYNYLSYHLKKSEEVAKEYFGSDDYDNLNTMGKIQVKIEALVHNSKEINGKQDANEKAENIEKQKSLSVDIQTNFCAESISQEQRAEIYNGLAAEGKEVMDSMAKNENNLSAHGKKNLLSVFDELVKEARLETTYDEPELKKGQKEKVQFSSIKPKLKK